MSLPIPARPVFAPSSPVRTTSFSSPLASVASSSASASAAPPQPPSPPVFSLSGDTGVEYATLPLPDHCSIRWRSFRPIHSSAPLHPAPPPPAGQPAQPENDPPPPPPPAAGTSSSKPSSTSTWTQAGVQSIESARRSIVSLARAHRTGRPGSRASFNLTDGLLAIACPAHITSTPDKPVDVQHPSPASIDGSHAQPDEGHSGELWVFAISSDQLDDDDHEEGQLTANGELFKTLKGLHWDNLQESSSGLFYPSQIYPATSDPFSKTNNSKNKLSPLHPHAHLLPAYPTFLRAAKEAILEEMTAGSAGGIRYGDGIILAPSPDGGAADEEGASKVDEWGDCWKVSGSRSAVLLTFTLTVLPTLILLTPRARRIPYYPFPTQALSSSPPPPLGTNVILLPLGIKAVFVRTSTTPSSDARAGEEKTFWDGLEGRGVRAEERREERDWVVCWVPATSAALKGPVDGADSADSGRNQPSGGKEREKHAGGDGKAAATAQDASGAGTLVCWPSSLIFVDSHVSTSASSNVAHGLKAPPARSRINAPAPRTLPPVSLSSPSHLPGLWASLTCSSSRLATAQPLASKLPSTVSTDMVDDIALASGVYLEALVREREKEKERAEEERDRERRKKELEDVASMVDIGQGSAAGISGVGDGATGDASQAMGSPHGSDLWGSPSPSAEAPPVPHEVDVVQPASMDSNAEIDMMDWNWTDSGFDIGSLGLPNRTDDNAWGDEVGDDDFDFFNSAPLMPAETPFVAPTPGADGDSQAVANADQLQLLASLDHDPASFSLSPLPTDLLAPPSAGPQAAGQFSPSLDVDMASFSPSMMFPQSTTPIPHHASPGSGSLHVAASPASWAHQGRTPKTPKTPFSPFVEIEEDLLEEDEEDGLVGPSRVTRAPSTIGTVRTAFPTPGYDAIAFGRSHMLADEKYERGKFALPSPASPQTMVLYEPDRDRRKGWRGSIRNQGAHDEANARRDQLAQVVSLLPPWTQKHRSFPLRPSPSLRRLPSDADVEPHLRLLYDQLSNPKVGIISRLKESWSPTSSSLKRKRVSRVELARLPHDFGKRLRIGGSSSVFDKRGAVDGEQSDDEDATREDGEEMDWSRVGDRGFYPARANGSAIPIISGLDVRSDSHHIRAESEPSVGLDLLSSCFLGVHPVQLPSTIPLPHSHYPSAHPTPTPSTAPTPAAAAMTPAWAPTPTSPPVGSAAKETTAADIEQVADWLAREAVENPRFRLELQRRARKSAIEADEPALPLDAHLVSTSLRLVDGSTSARSRTLLSLSSLSDSAAASSTTAVESLGPPQLAVGHQSAVIKVSPPAVRFWDRIGLEPVGGRKDVVAFALFEPCAFNVNAKVMSWLGRVGSAYESRGFGKHTAGSASTFKGGIVPVSMADVGDALQSIVLDLPSSTPHIVFYLVAPPALKSASFSLRDVQAQILAFITRHSSSAHFNFHTVSLAQVIEAESAPASSRAALKQTALAMYDRLPRRVDRLIPRRMFPEDLSPSNTSSAIAHPAFHIAWPAEKPIEVQFTLTWPPPTLNLLDRHMLLHVAYAVSASGEWLVAMAVDERGQSQETKVWRLEPKESYERLVGRLWAFATGFAKTADVEWRMVVCKSGLMGWEEVAAWDTLLSQRIPLHAPPLHVFLTCTDSSPISPFLLSPDSVTPSASSAEALLPKKPSTTSFFLDVSHLALALFPSHRTPYATPLASSHAIAAPRTLTPLIDEILPLTSFTLLHVPPNPTLVSSASVGPSSSISSLGVHHLLSFASPTSSALSDGGKHFRRDLALSLHALDVLGRERAGGMGDVPGGLPLHLRGVDTMREVVEGVREGVFGL